MFSMKVRPTISCFVLDLQIFSPVCDSTTVIQQYIPSLHVSAAQTAEVSNICLQISQLEVFAKGQLSLGATVKVRVSVLHLAISLVITTSTEFQKLGFPALTRLNKFNQFKHLYSFGDFKKFS